MEYDIKNIIGIIAGVIAFLAYVFYIIAIIKGETKPDKATWWIWSFMGLVLGTSYYFSGASNTLWVPLAEVLGPLTIALLSFKYGEGGLADKTDLFCLFGGVISIVLWIIFKNPVLALVTNITTDIFAAIPTIRKSYLRPEGEDLFAWILTGSANTLNLFAIERFTFGVIIYPMYMFILDGIIIVLLMRGKRHDIINHNENIYR